MSDSRPMRATDGGRRLRAVPVTGGLIEEVFRDGYATPRLTVSGGVPDGARLFLILEGRPPGTWLFVFEHPDFDTVPGGVMPPLMHPVVTREEPA